MHLASVNHSVVWGSRKFKYDLAKHRTIKHSKRLSILIIGTLMIGPHIQGMHLTQWISNYRTMRKQSLKQNMCS